MTGLLIVGASIFGAVVLIVHELIRDDNTPEPVATEGEEESDEDCY